MMKSHKRLAIYLLLSTIIATLSSSDGKQGFHNKNVKTKKCFMCHTLYDSEDCQHVNRLDNETQVCNWSNDGYCMVRSFAYSANGTDLKVWMMERKCATTCINECVITGDRNKLHLCTSCCQEHLCNVGNRASNPRQCPHYYAYNFFIGLFFSTTAWGRFYYRTAS